MKTTFTLLLVFIQFSIYSQNIDNEIIIKLVNQWHKDATMANGESYFTFMTDDAIYIGTDETEIWTKKQFISFAKPYFDAGKTWDFTVKNRNIYFSADKKVAWFDELLDTWMGVCKASGVLEKVNNEWKLKHYNLSLAVPNQDINEVIKIISSDDKIKK